MHLEKNRTYACTFPVQRKEIDVVKVRFAMRYSSRKLSNDKIITTACNFWRQIACSFQVMSGNILFLGNKIFEIPPFFQTRPGDLGKSSRMLSTFFRPEGSLTQHRGKTSTHAPGWAFPVSFSVTLSSQSLPRASFCVRLVVQLFCFMLLVFLTIL